MFKLPLLFKKHVAGFHVFHYKGTLKSLSMRIYFIDVAFIMTVVPTKFHAAYLTRK